MKDFFNKLDKLQAEKSQTEAERERIGRAHYKLAEQYAMKLAEFLKPYVAEFEERNYRCDETINGPYYQLRIRNSQKNAEIAIVNADKGNSFEMAGFENDHRAYGMPVADIAKGFDKRQVKDFVEKIFESLF